MSPHTHIEFFAELTARLDHPFADRAAVLRSAGFDDATYRRHLDRWSADLASALSPELARRFGEAYERAARALTAPSGDSAAPDPRFLNADVQSFREEAAVVALHAPADVAMSADPGSPQASPLPVHLSPRPAIVAIAEPSGAPPWIPEGMRPIVDVHGTQEIPDLSAKPALPLDPSALSSLASAPPRPVDPSFIVPERRRHFDDAHETQNVPLAPARPALPFEPPVPPPLPPSTAPAPWIPPGMLSFTDLERTQLTPEAPPAGPALVSPGGEFAAGTRDWRVPRCRPRPPQGGRSHGARRGGG
jgi:hypothetical protein